MAGPAAPSQEQPRFSAASSDSVYWDENGVLETVDDSGNTIQLVRSGPETEPTSVDMYENGGYVGTFHFTWSGGEVLESTYTNYAMWATVDSAGTPTGSTWGDPCLNDDSPGDDSPSDPSEPDPVDPCGSGGDTLMATEDNACEDEELAFWSDAIAAVGLDKATDLRSIVKIATKKAIGLGKVVAVLQGVKAGVQGLAWAACEINAANANVARAAVPPQVCVAV